MELEVREEAGPQTDTTSILVNNTPAYPVSDQPELIVRAEEVLLVVLVLMLWVAAIALFFNRWGQIRTLEPYQPKFQQNHHRTSCPLAPLTPPHITPQQRMSFSKYNVNCFSDTYTGLPSPVSIRRPRLNSVFVGSSTMAFMNTPPRRAKSAMDIQHLIINERSKRASISGFNSMLPMTTIHRERKPSITIDRPIPLHGRRRPSAVIDRPMLAHYHHGRNRRTSCFIDRRHKNFISFDQSERKLSITIEKAPHSEPPSVSFDTTPSISFDSPTVIVEHAEINHCNRHGRTSNSPKTSRSFEHPPLKVDKMVAPRMSTSLDVQASAGEKTSTNSSSVSSARTSINIETPSLDKESTSASTETHDHSAVVSFEDAAPLLEDLKSSDV